MAILRVKEFYRARVRPCGLSLFKPDAMFAIVGPILDSSHSNRIFVCYCIHIVKRGRILPTGRWCSKRQLKCIINKDAKP